MDEGRWAMGDGRWTVPQAGGDDRGLATVEELASTWKPERGVEGKRAGKRKILRGIGRGKKTRLVSSKESYPPISTGVYRCRSLRRSKKKERSPQLGLFPNPSTDYA